MIGLNHFVPFKDRRPNLAKPVYLYRNLNGDTHHLFSLKQGGLVVGHTNRMVLGDVTFVISRAGQARVRRTKAKNVHAYLKGRIARKGAMGSDGLDARRWPVRITYNPYCDDHFMGHQTAFEPYTVKAAFAAVVSADGVFASDVSLR